MLIKFEKVKIENLSVAQFLNYNNLKFNEVQ